MKNSKKKKITRNYHLLTKVESGKCRRETAVIDGICLLKKQRKNPNESTNRKTTFSRPENVYWNNVMFFSQMTVTQKEKLRQSPHRFGRSVTEHFEWVSRSPNSFAYARAVNISWYFRLTFAACDWF